MIRENNNNRYNIRLFSNGWMVDNNGNHNNSGKVAIKGYAEQTILNPKVASTFPTTSIPFAEF